MNDTILDAGMKVGLSKQETIDEIIKIRLKATPKVFTKMEIKDDAGWFKKVLINWINKRTLTENEYRDFLNKKTDAEINKLYARYFELWNKMNKKIDSFVEYIESNNEPKKPKM